MRCLLNSMMKQLVIRQVVMTMEVSKFDQRYIYISYIYIYRIVVRYLGRG